MPVIIITGHPRIGKTRTAHLIAERAANMPDSPYNTITIVNEESAMPDKTKHDAYCNSHAEKSTRAALKSAFERALCGGSGNTTNLVILDSLNYIKGYRYELHCIARAHRQQYCVLWLLNDVRYSGSGNDDVGIQESSNEQADEALSEEAMDALVMRYEAPDGRNRWDKPLFKLDLSLYNNNHNQHQQQQQEIKEEMSEKKALQKSVYNMHNLSASMDEIIKTTTTSLSSQNDDASSLIAAIDDILHTLTHNTTQLNQNTSTKLVVAAKADVLHDVDRITQQAITRIIQTQKLQGSSNSGCRVVHVFSDKSTCTLELVQEVSLAELRRLRRQFIKWVKLHSVEDGSEQGIVKAFFGYIQAQL